MGKGVTKWIAKKLIAVGPYVRKDGLDESRVKMFSDLRSNGVPIEPIEVMQTDTNILPILSGKHRFQSLEALGVGPNELIEVRVLPQMSDVDALAYAYQANMGGSMPPTTSDTYMVIEDLLGKGVPGSKIHEYIKVPRSLAKQYVMRVTSDIHKRGLNRALTAISDGGLTVATAAAKFDVPEASIKQAMTGKKKRLGDASTMQGEIGKRMHAVSVRNALTVKKALDFYDDGLMDFKGVEKVLGRWKHGTADMIRRVKDWEKRAAARKKA